MTLFKHYLKRLIDQFKRIDYKYYFDSSNNQSPYYIDFRGKIDKRITLDSNGIPLTDCPFHKNQFDKKTLYNPTKIALYTLTQIDEYMSRKDQNILNHIDILIQWFLDNYLERNGSIFWGTFCDYDRYNVLKPYPSSMVQGLVLSILARYNKFCKVLKNVEEIVDKILNSFVIESKNGGIKTMLDNEIFFEETPSSPPSYILNGFIFSLFGLFDAVIYFKKDIANSLFRSGIKSLEKNILKFDLGYWSSYDFLYKEPATFDYHKLHISQLHVLAKMTNNEVFHAYAIKWKIYSDRLSYKYKALIKKVYCRIIIK